METALVNGTLLLQASKSVVLSVIVDGFALQIAVSDYGPPVLQMSLG